MENLFSRHFQKRLCNAQRQINAYMQNNWRMNYCRLGSVCLGLIISVLSNIGRFGFVHANTLIANANCLTWKNLNVAHWTWNKGDKRSEPTTYTLNSFVQKMWIIFIFVHYSFVVTMGSGHCTLYTVHHNITM